MINLDTSGQQRHKIITSFLPCINDEGIKGLIKGFTEINQCDQFCTAVVQTASVKV